ncbi:MBL fold metallo-hydrolase [Sorangium cellulosum]|uniref:MBL fold metallo-hydrolase n=1 Tax=Sorangium cellulosum TaxID=56 RepID=UPI000AC80EB1|nr:MBL fold metallo-hydrolase [Sorangium cellulosum]
MPALPPHITFLQRGVLNSNSVVVHAPDAFLVFDTGYCTGARALERAIAEQAGRPLAELALIVNTHAHPDHTGGNAHLQERSGCEIVTSDIDRMLIESGDPVTLMRDWADLQCPSFGVTRAVRPGETLAFGVAEFIVVEGAGHAAGEVSYYCARDKLLICGDLLWQSGFSNVVPLVEGIGGLARHERSLSGLRELDVEIAIPGHGPLVVGRDAVRQRIDESIETIRFYRAHRDRWASTVLKSFIVMHVLAGEQVTRSAFVARCERSPWFQEQAARFFPRAERLLDALIDELLGRRILRAENDRLTCSLSA